MLIGLLALILPVGTGDAQVPPGQSAVRTETIPVSSRSKMIAHCVVGRARNSSRRLVLSTGSDRIGGKDRGAIERAIGGCMSALDASITLGIFDLRGDLAEEFLTENGGAQLRRSSALVPHEPQRVAAGLGVGDVDEAVIACAVTADPADGAGMIGAGVETPSEMAKFRKLLPGVQACVPKDSELHLKPFEVRRLVAISLFRLTDGVPTMAEKK